MFWPFWEAYSSGWRKDIEFCSYRKLDVLLKFFLRSEFQIEAQLWSDPTAGNAEEVDSGRNVGQCEKLQIYGFAHFSFLMIVISEETPIGNTGRANFERRRNFKRKHHSDISWLSKGIVLSEGSKYHVRPCISISLNAVPGESRRIRPSGACAMRRYERTRRITRNGNG